MRHVAHHEGCNHGLTNQVVADFADELLRTFGNSEFDPMKLDRQGDVHELVQNGFLRLGSDGSMYHCGKQVIGPVPRKRRGA